MKNELQVENGNYTRIVNKIIDELVKIPLLGVELSICLFVIRKTYGFNKTEDEISLTQFMDGLKRTRPTIVKALKNLVFMKILVRVDAEAGKTTKWKFNKYYEQWKVERVVKRRLLDRLVKRKRVTSKENTKKVVNIRLHTKDNTKDNITKDIRELAAPTPSQIAIRFFKGVQDLKSKKETDESEITKKFLQHLSDNYPNTKKSTLWEEIQKFWAYWTELNPTGTKQKWQLQKTFQVDRRLLTWFGKVGFKAQKGFDGSKGREIIGLE